MPKKSDPVTVTEAPPVEAAPPVEPTPSAPAVTAPAGPAIYAALSRVMAEVGAVGKNQRNESQNYKFRGVDDLYAAAQLVMAKHGVVCVPSILTTEWGEVATARGGTMRHLKATIAYDFYAADGSSVRAVTLGESMDSGDKSSYKAMAGASKYALLQTFLIPTSEPKDPENDSPEAIGPALGKQTSGPVIEPATEEETKLFLSIIENSKAMLPLNQLKTDLVKRFGTKEAIPEVIRNAWVARGKALTAGAAS